MFGTSFSFASHLSPFRKKSEVNVRNILFSLANLSMMQLLENLKEKII